MRQPSTSFSLVCYHKPLEQKLHCCGRWDIVSLAQAIDFAFPSKIPRKTMVFTDEIWWNGVAFVTHCLDDCGKVRSQPNIVGQRYISNNPIIAVPIVQIMTHRQRTRYIIGLVIWWRWWWYTSWRWKIIVVVLDIPRTAKRSNCSDCCHYWQLRGYKTLFCPLIQIIKKLLSLPCQW